MQGGASSRGQLNWPELRGSATEELTHAGLSGAQAAAIEFFADVLAHGDHATGGDDFYSRCGAARRDLERERPPEYVRLFGSTTVVCSPMTARGRWLGVIIADRGEDGPLN